MSAPLDNYIIKSPFNAEAIYVSLLEAGHHPDHIKIYNRSSFKKSYSTDVERIEVAAFDNEYHFELTLNRDGIYDSLPEGLFHQTKGNNRVNAVPDAVEEHKQFKEEEKQARKFFAPIEQMLFNYRAAAEEKEREALYDIQNGRLNQSFYNFWNLDTDLPAEPAKRLLQLMPYISYIKGSRELTAAALSYILSKQVIIETEEKFITDSISRNNLDQLRLGIDAVIGQTSREQSPYWSCKINNIADEELNQYTSNASMERLLNRFTEIFIPLDIDILFDVMPPDSELKETHENILGVGCYL